MGILTDPFTPTAFPDLFTWMWVAGLVIATGSIVVYTMAQRRYRRYPVILELHEWVFWPIVIGWVSSAPRRDRRAALPPARDRGAGDGHRGIRHVHPLPAADRRGE